jgi:hypothetical protein
MRAAGATVRHAGDAFPFGSPDAVWLSGAGKRGWIVLSRDQKVRYRLLERMALEEAGVAAFVFTGGEATGAETAATICKLLRKMTNMAVSERKPFMYTFGLGGSLTRVPVGRK